MGFKFDNAAVFADYFGDKCKTEARARRFGRDERVEEIGCDVFGHARTTSRMQISSGRPTGSSEPAVLKRTPGR